ncbi:MAG: hypothetical protein Ct9H300mP1_07650 [Planctomycetaceae bacterium]|nr:MAG: hypothetical protein Ct9H300mP1_07650 [Planctomycetaceae bacterium]
MRLVTIDFPCVPGQKAFSWDDHASVWNIFEQMKIRLPVLDQVTSALIEDLHERGCRTTCFCGHGRDVATPRVHYVKGNPGRNTGHGPCRCTLRGGMTMGSRGCHQARGSFRFTAPGSPGICWRRCTSISGFRWTRSSTTTPATDADSARRGPDRRADLIRAAVISRGPGPDLDLRAFAETFAGWSCRTFNRRIFGT